jgi:hypothetical protein
LEFLPVPTDGVGRHAAQFTVLSCLLRPNWAQTEQGIFFDITENFDSLLRFRAAKKCKFPCDLVAKNVSKFGSAAQRATALGAS